MPARPTESVVVEPENSSRGGAHNQQHKHTLQDAETSVYQQDRVSAEYWNGHERVGEGQIRWDNLRGGDQCPRVSEETATYRQPHSDDGQTFRKIPLLPGSSRSEKLRSLPPGLARVPPAHFGGRKPDEFDEALVAFFNEKYRVGYSSSTGDIQLGAMCHYFPEFGKYGGSLLATLPMCETPYAAEEQPPKQFVGRSPSMC